MTSHKSYGYAGRWDLALLVAARHEHLTALTHHHYTQPLPPRLVAEHALAMLALGERIAAHARASRWVYATEALAAGAPAEHVAAALDLPHAHALREQLRTWVDQQTYHGLMRPDRRAQVLALLTTPDEADGEVSRP